MSDCPNKREVQWKRFHQPPISLESSIFLLVIWLTTRHIKSHPDITVSSNWATYRSLGCCTVLNTFVMSSSGFRLGQVLRGRLGKYIITKEIQDTVWFAR